MKKGIVLIAAGHPAYGTWALNLCMSIKMTNPDANVTLLHYGAGASHVITYGYMFDSVVEIPVECVTKNGMESILRSKVCLYDLSPYQETIFIDADVIGFPQKKISDLFNVLKDVEFTMGNRGIIDPVQESRYSWAPAQVIMDALKYDGPIYNLSSEFIYFKKTKAVKTLFKAAQKAFDDPGIEYRRFAGGVPDELAFQIAMIKTGMKPHKENFLPFYWEAHEKKQLQLHELYRTEFYGYSMGGNAIHAQPMQQYNDLAKYYANQFGLKHSYPMREKREIMTNLRTQI